jgi:predicted MFS family arabinose efflux permease
MAQGITGITVAVGGLVISRMLSGNRKVAISIIALRGLWLSLAMPLMYKEETLILYLIGMYFLGLAMDASLFNLYSESSSGYGTHSYFISRELGTLIGSLLAGLVLASGIKEAIFIFPIIFTVSSAIQLL